MKAFSVLIADSNSRLSQLLGQLLADEPGFRVLGVHGAAERALEAAAERRPDLVLLSDRLEGKPVAPLCERLRAVVPRARLVMWSNDPTSRSEGEAAADALVERGTTSRELVHDLRVIAERSEDDAAETRADAVAQPPAPRSRHGRGLLDDPEGTGALLLNCDSCSVQVRIATDDVAPGVEEARRFFAGHSECVTAVDVTERLTLSTRI